MISTFFATHVRAQAPVCDVMCTPDTSGPLYSGAAMARSSIRNARGYSSPIVARTQVRAAAGLAGNTTVIGSQSYNYTIPILRLPGRAGMDLVLNLYYNSRIWDVDTVGSTITFNADRDFPSYGFRLDFGYIEVIPGTEVILTEGDGTKRALPLQGSAVFNSTDGSNIVFDLSGSNILTYKNGTMVQYQQFPSNANLLRPVWVRDSNGNYFSITYLSGHDQLIATVSDSLGRVINFNYDGSAHLTSLTQALHPSGTKTYATFTWGAPYASNQTWYSFAPSLTVQGTPTPSQITVLTGCTYPNSTGYRFTYGDWGIITKIENLSATGVTRSYVSYNYPLASQGALTDAPAYTQQAISPDGTAGSASVWTYAITKDDTGAVTTMAVTDPLGNSSITNLDPGTGLASSVQEKDSANTLLRTFTYSWTSTPFLGSTVVGSLTTTLNDTGQQSSVQYGYDFFDNVSDISEYDFGLQLKRHTVISYLNAANTGAPHIVNLPTQVLVKDGQGNVLARTDLAYDATSPLSVTGAANHDDIAYGAGFNIRGNLTSVTRYSNAAGGTGPVTRNFTYDTLGNLRAAQLDCCNQKVFNFSSVTQYSAPDSIVRGPSGGPQFTTSYAYNPDNNLLLNSTDENNQVTNYQYDSMKRSTQVLLPPQGATQVQINTAFDDAAASPAVTSSSTANSATSVSTLDGLGHVMRVDYKNGATVVSSVIYGYDKLWQKTLASNPFAPAGAVANTTFSYDALGRVKQVTPPSAGAMQYQYSGNAVTITDPAGKQRRTFTDALGRMIEVDEPGWGDAVHATGSVTISGSERFGCTNVIRNFCVGRFWDTGTVSITVNGVTKSYAYGQTDTPGTIASALALAFHNDGTAPVDATASGSTVNLTARQAGVLGDYSLSASSATNDPADFGGPSFSATPSGVTLTGGLDAVAQSSPNLNRPIVTTYGYDALSNLTSVSQAAMQLVNGQPVTGQPRSYAYDSLGRVTSSTTPESGTVTTYYTDSGGATCAVEPGLPCQIQDARGVLKTFSYDGINRPIGVAYSDGTPSVTYQYDTGGQTAFALGRLTKILEGPTNSQTFTYDNFGRIKSISHVIDSTTYLVQYAYNLASDLSSITYPSNRVVTQNYDAMGRLCAVGASGSTCTTGTTYLNGLTYNAAGETLGLTMGNGVQGTFSYNDHLQVATLRYFKGSTDMLNLAYDYTTGVPGNNGQIQAVHYYTSPGVEDPTKSENFTYDNWGRLSTAHTTTVNSTAGTWSLQWAYDRLGNRTLQTLVGGNVTIGQPQFAIDSNTNRIIGYCYDAAGNLLDEGTCPAGTHHYSYDGANRLTKINAGPPSYTYFGTLRIKKVAGSTTTVYIYSGSKPIAEYVNGSTTPSSEYVYAGSQLLATIAGTNTTYHHPDHLSNRAETDKTGVRIRTFGHFPFGEAWYETGTADKWKFTSFERDSGTGETGLDYAMFRYYASGQGRFMSPDLLGGKQRAPQSLNRYAYAANDPINLADPMGLFVVCLGHFHSDDGGETWDLVETLGCWDTDEGGRGGDDEGGDGAGGGGGGEGNSAARKLRDLWTYCLDKFGDDYAKENLTVSDFYEAQAAAEQAGIETSALLALWDNESHFNVTGWAKNGKWTTGPKGERGPLQVRPIVARDLSRHGVSPGNYRNDFDDNLLAAANYYALVLNKYDVPESDAASVYNGGIGNYRSNSVSDDAAAYQNSFDNNKMKFDDLVKCLHGAKQ